MTRSIHRPIVRPAMYDHYGFDNYPNGMNAVVAVIAYTGYDMEDAMVKPTFFFLFLVKIIKFVDVSPDSQQVVV